MKISDKFNSYFKKHFVLGSPNLTDGFVCYSKCGAAF